MIDGETYPGYSTPGSLSGVLLFRGIKDNPDRDNLSTEKDESDKEQQKGLLCRVCHQLITTSKESLEKDGKHLHTFFNPAGIVYEIGCFRRAPGCLPFGAPSSEFAWFGGYSWQVVYCRSCQQHLGWRFSGEDRFYGLVVNKLTEG
ncbi:MAG: cereblon family protein [Desulfocapsaceae bacterium]